MELFVQHLLRKNRRDALQKLFSLYGAESMAVGSSCNIETFQVYGYENHADNIRDMKFTFMYRRFIRM